MHLVSFRSSKSNRHEHFSNSKLSLAASSPSRWWWCWWRWKRKRRGRSSIKHFVMGCWLLLAVIIGALIESLDFDEFHWCDLKPNNIHRTCTATFVFFIMAWNTLDTESHLPASSIVDYSNGGFIYSVHLFRLKDLFKKKYITSMSSVKCAQQNALNRPSHQY